LVFTLLASAAFAAISLYRMAPPDARHAKEPARAERKTPAVAPAVPKEADKPSAVSEKPAPRVAIVIDDIGRHEKPVEKLLKVGIPLTFSILPGLPHSRSIAETVNEAGYEVMLHLPMEPEDGRRNNPGRNALMLSHTDEEVRRLLKGMINDTPHIAGINNHMGSRFTKDREKMSVVLGQVRDSGLYFIDSFTTPDSVAFERARELGMRSGARDLFLDNERDVEKIKGQLRRAVRLAKKNGGAIVIGHPYPQTIEAIGESADDFREAGVELVFASKMVR